jgi:putative transposase
MSMSLPKVTKNSSPFLNDVALMKLLYLALSNISKKWTIPLRGWKPTLNRFTI